MCNYKIQLHRCLSLFFCMVCLAIAAPAQTIPLGNYTAVIPQDVRVGNLTFLGGESQLTLLAGGQYRLGRNDFITLSGAYSVTGNLIEFASPATMDTCSGKGTYQWTYTGNRLTLTAATARVDSCVERLVGLTGAAFFKDDPAASVWKNFGPTGGQFNAVMIFNGKVYAGSGGGGFIGATGEFTVAAAAPTIFTMTANGTGAAAAIDAFTGAVGPFNATQGNGQPNILAVFGTGLGAEATDQDGNVNTSVTATIGGRAATVQYAGRAPGFAGLNQFNLTLPTGLAAGTHTLIVTRGGVTSNAVTIAIK